MRQALIPYQDYHTLSLRIRGLCTGLDRVLRHYEKEGSKMREEGPSDDGGNKPNQAQAVQHMLRYGAWAILDAEDEQARILNPLKKRKKACYMRALYCWISPMGFDREWSSRSLACVLLGSSQAAKSSQFLESDIDQILEKSSRVVRESLSSPHSF